VTAAFYNAALDGFNFQSQMVRFDQVLDSLAAYLDAPAPPTLYVGSTTIDTCLPGLRAENDLNLGPRDPLASLWIGNRTRIPAHYDVPDNLACVAAGRRRFTLFPPQQLKNLYVGPLDMTPAGQSVSMVDLHAPTSSATRALPKRWRRPVGRAGGGRRRVHSQHVVAPRGGAGAVQYFD
jgi:hypothetical protein